MTSVHGHRTSGIGGLAVAAFLLAGLVRPAAAQSASDPLYVCIQDDARIAVLDMSTRSLTRVIDLTELGFSANAKPHHVVGEPDGSYWYVSLIGDNRVIKLDGNDRVVAQAGTEVPGLMALAPDMDRLVVSRSMSAVNPPHRIAVLRPSSFDLEEVDVFFPRPHPMVIAHGRAYTGSLGVNQMATVDLDDETVELTDLEGDPHSLVQFAVSRDGSTLVASTDVSGRLLVFDLSDAVHPRLTHSVALGPQAFHPAFAPDGGAVWVPVKSADEIAVVDTESWSVRERIHDDAVHQPHAVAFSADGRSAFVSFNNKAVDAGAGSGEREGGVAVIDVPTRKVVDVIALGHNPTGMGTRGR